MKIPKNLKIGGHIIAIERRPLIEIDSECNGGWAIWEKNKIVIADDIPESRQLEILVHEVLHFVNIYMDESDVTYLSSILFQIWDDNKMELAQLISNDKKQSAVGLKNYLLENMELINSALRADYGAVPHAHCKCMDKSCGNRHYHDCDLCRKPA